MTSVSVGEVLTLPVLRGSRLLAGADGVGRSVTGVNVMEVPDIEAFVKGGELLLTTTYPLRENPERLPELVRTLHRLKVAALAVKTGRYLDELPAEVLAVADELNFPVVEVPESTSFNEVIGALLAVVLTEYGAEVGRAEAIRDRLTGVALSGGGLNEIARTLAGALAVPVEILDADGVRLGHAGGDLDGDGVWTFPVTVAGRQRGHIAVGGTAEPTLGERRLIRQACFAAGMHVAQALASLDLDRHMRVLFLEDLVTGRTLDAALTRERYRLFGWDFARPHAVVVARVDAIFSGADLGERLTAGLPVGSVAWTRGTDVLALVPADDHVLLHEVAQQWRTALRAAGAEQVRVAAGPAAAQADRFSHSHRLAREALEVAIAIDSAAVSYDDLRLERLLLALPGRQLAGLVADQLGPLLEADATGHADLCRTLEVYLGTGNAAEAARQLFIHYNTMKHRLNRIVDLLKVDLHDPRVRLSLNLALVARRLRPHAEATVR